MNVYIKPLALIILILACSISFLFADPPEPPVNLSWDYTTDVLSWESSSDPAIFQIKIYKNGNHEKSIPVTNGSARSQNLHSELLNLGSPATYTATVQNPTPPEAPISILSPANIKGMASLDISAVVEYGSNSDNFIFSRSSATSFERLPFTYDSTRSTYDYSTNFATESLKLSFPASGQYQLKAEYHGSSTITTFTQAMVTGDVYVPLRIAASSAGMDANGNPNADTQNNVLTIVVNPGNAGFEKTYTLRFRRRANNPPTSITGINHSAYAFDCVVNGSGGTPQTINGDNLSSFQELRWSVNSLGGTAYFTGNQMTPLSNGNISVTATLANVPTISATSDLINLSGYSNWAPHLGKLEVRGKTGDDIKINPIFSSDPSAAGLYSCSILDDYSSLKLKLMAPTDSQVYINGARVSSNGESILRIEPTVTTATNYTIRVENAQGYKDYALKVQREVNARLKFGRQTGSTPYLTSATGDVFGINSANTDNLTVQSWVRWTVDPADTGNDAWANIAAQTTSGDGTSGLFWLQHNNFNSAFEFAVRTTGSRQYVQSNTALVTIQRGVWYLVTGVYDGSRLRIYVNDTEVNNRTVSMTGKLTNVPTNAQFNVGKMPLGTRRFPGNVRALRIWVGEARSASQIAADYAGTSTNDSDFSWPLNETAIGSVTRGNGTVDLNMVNVIGDDFTTCCVNNRATGQALLHRPERMDLSTADSESVILVQASSYSGSDLRFRLLGPEGGSTGMEAWDHVTNTWIGSGEISSGIKMDAGLGDPAAGTYFWVPVRRNTMLTGGGRYVDDDSSYDGADTNAATRTQYNTIMPLPAATAMGTTFSISGDLVGTTEYPLSKKYVILGYDAVEKGRLITGTSSSRSAKDGKAAGSFTLYSDVPLQRIEVRTQKDVLITQ
ncbi:MAG: LamG domain-containing protein, partial [Candidatus Cloacimonetes bacterium]|nr:LamG domain-containing protein [Candidatus Cloacimonadota bacterium]